MSDKWIEGATLFEGGIAYNNQSRATIYLDAWCCKCDQHGVPVVLFNSSDGEYSDITLCISCLEQVLIDFKKIITASES